MELPVWYQIDCPPSFVWIAMDMALGRARPPEFDSSRRLLTPVFNEINHLAAVF
jgi:hypothetical protein